MALHKVRHAMANWTNEDGTPGMAFRNQVVEIPDNEAARLKKHFALIGPDEEVEHPGILSDLPQSPSDEELLNWIENANVSEVRALTAQRPELVPRIEGALSNVYTARAYEDTHLNEVRLALQQKGLSPDEISLGSSLKTGTDPSLRDTSDDGDNSDIIMPENPSGASLEPPAGGAGVAGPETNTELKDANGNPDSLPAMNHEVLVQGTGVDVANYIAAHPEQAAAILEAETVHTEGSPRPEVVKAVRAANDFTS
jgi:hypothetical protein